jgi:excisionase family DNA binding protein
MLLTVKDLSAWLNMKPSTLYLWAGQGKIPCRKIHGLIRFDQEEIHQWLASFAPARGRELSLSSPSQPQSEVERLIAAAKRDVYTPARETRPRDKKGVSPDRFGCFVGTLRPSCHQIVYTRSFPTSQPSHLKRSVTVR